MLDAIQSVCYGLISLCVAYACLGVVLMRADRRARSARIAADLAARRSAEQLGRIERDVVELVEEKRRRDAAGRERIRFYMRAARRGSSPDEARAAEAPGEGDDGEAGEEAGPAEAEDPEGERGA